MNPEASSKSLLGVSVDSKKGMGSTYGKPNRRAASSANVDLAKTIKRSDARSLFGNDSSEKKKKRSPNRSQARRNNFKISVDTLDLDQKRRRNGNN